MPLSKKQLLTGVLIFQSIVILFLIQKTIWLLNENLSNQATAEYFRKAYEESSLKDDHLIQSLLDEKESLLRELNITQEVAKGYGIHLTGSEREIRSESLHSSLRTR